MKFFCYLQKFKKIKNMFKVAKLYLFIVFIQFNTVFYLMLNLKLKINPKRVLSKTWKEFLKNSYPPWYYILRA